MVTQWLNSTQTISRETFNFFFIITVLAAGMTPCTNLPLFVLFSRTPNGTFSRNCATDKDYWIHWINCQNFSIGTGWEVDTNIINSFNSERTSTCVNAFTMYSTVSPAPYITFHHPCGELIYSDCFGSISRQFVDIL